MISSCSFTCRGGVIITLLYASCGVRQGHDYLHHPRFLRLPFGMQAGQQSWHGWKKKAIDFRMKSLFLPPMTALLSGPPHHAPRAIIVWGFFVRVNGGGLIRRFSNRVIAQLLPDPASDCTGSFLLQYLCLGFSLAERDSGLGPLSILVSDWSRQVLVSNFGHQGAIVAHFDTGFSPTRQSGSRL